MSLAQPASPLTSPVVLVVDDDPDALEMYTIGLCACGFDVVTASDADQARTVARQREPDVVVTDARLGRTCGVALAHALRNDIVTSHAPIVLLTGDPRVHDASRPRPYDRFLLKPCTPQALAQELVSLLVRPLPLIQH